MFCPNCGHENAEEARYCGACGSALAATAEAPPSSVSRTPGSIAGTAPAAGEESLRQKEIFTYWAYRGLALVVALLTVVILVGSYLFGLLLAALGACLWVGVTGKRPGTQRRVNPVVRAVLGVVLFAANGSVAAGAVAIYYAFEYRPSLATAVGLGSAVFVGAAAVEAVAILLVLGAIKLIRRLWRQADYATLRNEPDRGERYALP